MAAKITGHAVADDTSRWVAARGASLANKLAAVGLTDAQTTTDWPATLGPFVARYIKEFSPIVKAATVTTWKQAQRLLLEHFSPDTPIAAITEGHALGFRNYLRNRDHTRIARAGKLSRHRVAGAGTEPCCGSVDRP